MREIIIAKDAAKLNCLAAEKFVSMARDALDKNGKFTVALAGGSTPKSLYNLLASEEFRSQIDWKRVFFFFGDERNVLPDAAESNFRMANENLLEPLEISAENIFRWRNELGDAKKIADDYAKTLRDFFKADFPRFDLILLGIGEDGHTASLFPFSGALGETQKIAVANFVEKLDTNRLTLTFPVINHAANVIFLASGAAKAEILAAVLRGEFKPEKFPSQNVKPADGNLYWLADESAAQNLK